MRREDERERAFIGCTGYVWFWLIKLKKQERVRANLGAERGLLWVTTELREVGKDEPDGAL